MAERILGPTGSRRRRRFLFVPMLVVTAVALLFVAGAQAVHGEAFQLDGDVLASTTTNIGGATQSVDWDSLINADGTVKSSLPSGFDAATFDKDFGNTGTTFITSDTTTFATGSKDELAIADWQCNFDNNVNSKIDVMNAYAATYTDPVSGDDFIYFGLERHTNTGTADVGFWFLKNPVGCESTGGAADFQGAHADGDLLVVSEFTGGGTVSTIKVFRWDGDDATGELNTTPVAEGVDCRDPLLPATDGACGAANRVAITTPWLTAFKAQGPPTVGNNLPIAQFFEGGVNLTAADIEGCFTTYIADTRSSATTSATLFDYSSEALGGCTTDVNTTPVDNAGTPIPAGGLTIPGDPADAAILVKDRAEVIVEGIDTFNATLTFHLCGPFPAASTDLCTTGGVLVDTQNLTADGIFTSAAATVTSAGRYCWRADFSGDEDADVPPGSDSEATECFIVNPRQAGLTTQAGPDVTLGTPVTDTATLTNTAHDPGTGGPAGSTDGSINPATLGNDADGIITFTLYKDNACTVLATGTGTNPQTVNVSGNGTYGPVSFTPDAPGTYHWVASYSGDLPNTLASTPSACLDANEDVVVTGQAALATAQNWLPNDTATVSGPTNLNGTLTFQLYTGNNCGATSGAPVAGQSYSFTLANVASPASRTTTNTTFRVTDADEGAYSWLVHYDDTILTDPPDRCETSNVSITD